jgi:hypothetical protein
MKLEATVDMPHAPRANGAVNRLIVTLPRLFVPTFALMFYAFSICFAVSALVEFAIPVLEKGDFLGGLIKGLHTGVVALAVYELAEIVHQEYDPDGHSSQNVLARIRRGVARFGAVVIVALVLESLIMVIKYSQENLAGFLYYPAAIIVSAALLLTALGLFAKLTSQPVLTDR